MPGTASLTMIWIIVFELKQHFLALFEQQKGWHTIK
jgi:hypothetical protein